MVFEQETQILSQNRQQLEEAQRQVALEKEKALQADRQFRQIIVPQQNIKFQLQNPNVPASQAKQFIQQTAKTKSEGLAQTQKAFGEISSYEQNVLAPAKEKLTTAEKELADWTEAYYLAHNKIPLYAYADESIRQKFSLIRSEIEAKKDAEARLKAYKDIGLIPIIDYKSGIIKGFEDIKNKVTTNVESTKLTPERVEVLNRLGWGITTAKLTDLPAQELKGIKQPSFKSQPITTKATNVFKSIFKEYYTPTKSETGISLAIPSAGYLTFDIFPKKATENKFYQGVEKSFFTYPFPTIPLQNILNIGIEKTFPEGSIGRGAGYTLTELIPTTFKQSATYYGYGKLFSATPKLASATFGLPAVGFGSYQTFTGIKSGQGEEIGRGLATTGLGLGILNVGIGKKAISTARKSIAREDILVADIGELVPLKNRLSQINKAIESSGKKIELATAKATKKAGFTNVKEKTNIDYTFGIPIEFATYKVGEVYPTAKYFLEGKGTTTQKFFKTGILNIEKVKSGDINKIYGNKIKNQLFKYGKVNEKLIEKYFKAGQVEANLRNKPIVAISPKRLRGYYQAEQELIKILPDYYKPKKLKFSGFTETGHRVFTEKGYLESFKIFAKSKINKKKIQFSYWNELAREKQKYLAGGKSLFGEYKQHGMQHLKPMEKWNPLYKEHDIMKVADIDSYSKFPHGETAMKWAKEIGINKKMAEAYGGHEYVRFNLKSVFKERSKTDLTSHKIKQIYWSIKGIKNPYLQDIATLDRLDLVRFGIKVKRELLSEAALKRLFGSEKNIKTNLANIRKEANINKIIKNSKLNIYKKTYNYKKEGNYKKTLYSYSNKNYYGTKTNYGGYYKPKPEIIKTNIFNYNNYGYDYGGKYTPLKLAPEKYVPSQYRYPELPTIVKAPKKIQGTNILKQFKEKPYKINLKQITGYQPSFTGLILGIKGKAPAKVGRAGYNIFKVRPLVS